MRRKIGQILSVQNSSFYQKGVNLDSDTIGLGITPDHDGDFGDEVVFIVVMAIANPKSYNPGPP